ncbi:MAG TPA: hypothetical protein V6C58_20885 [Allocoleopsis sp.]
MSVSKKQRDEWEYEIKKDYPSINPWILKILLDSYCAEGGKVNLDNIIKQDIKNQRKNKKTVSMKPSSEDIYHQATITQWDETWEKKMKDFNEKVNFKCEVVEPKEDAPEKEISGIKIEECSQ